MEKPVFVTVPRKLETEFQNSIVCCGIQLNLEILFLEQRRTNTVALETKGQGVGPPPNFQRGGIGSSL